MATALHAAGGITAQLLILGACESGSTAVVDTFRNLMTRPDHVLIVAADGYIDWTACERAIHNLVDLAHTGIPAIEAARTLPSSAPYCVAQLTNAASKAGRTSAGSTQACLCSKKECTPGAIASGVHCVLGVRRVQGTDVVVVNRRTGPS
ncbi:hypothetical protein GCM10010530_68600 [Kribbella aluminosa]